MQKKLVEGWLALGVLLVVVIVFQDASWNVQWAFLPFVLYYLFNWPTFSEFSLLNKRFFKTSLQNEKIKVWVYTSSCILIAMTTLSLLKEFNPIEHLGIGSLLLIVSLPLLPALVLSQIAVFEELGK